MIATRAHQKVVKLLDFGIAKLIHPEPGEAGLTTAGRRLGTPSAMAPEQFRGDPVDARTDIYALGVLLYRLLTGQLPFPGASSEEIERSHLNAPAPPPSRVAPISPAMDAIVLRCLEKKPGKRFASAAEFGHALRQIPLTEQTARLPIPRAVEATPAARTGACACGTLSRAASVPPSPATEAE